MMSGYDYWQECISVALDEAGVAATAEQIVAIASTVEGAHETYGEANGHDVASRNLAADEYSQLDHLKKQLRAEQEKIPCPTCEGRRVPTMNGQTEPARLTCDACNRTGKIA